MSISERIRPGIEAAEWVCAEVIGARLMNDAKNEAASGASHSNTGLGAELNPDWEPPEVSGWHWLQKYEQPPRPFYWNATCKEWHDSWDGSVQSIDRFSTLSHRYIAPCPAPNAEITGRTLAQNEADGA